MNIASGNLQWYDILLIGVYAAILLPVPFFALRAMRPRKGTLEWIAQYDRGSMHLTQPRKALTGRDAVWLLLTGAAAVLVAAVVLLLQIKLYSPQNMRSMTPAYYVKYYAYPMAGAVFMFLLARDALQTTVGGVFAGVIMAAEPLGDRLPVALLTLSLHCLHRWLTAGEERRLLLTEPWLYASALLLGVCALMDWTMFWLLPFYAVCFAAKCFARGRSGRRGSGRRLTLSLLLFVLVCLLAAAAAVSLHAVRSGWTELSGLPQLWMERSLYTRCLERARWVWAYCTARPACDPLRVLAHLLPTLLLGVCALPMLLSGLLRRRDAQALFILGLLLSFAAAWVLTGSFRALPALALAGSYLLTHYVTRRKNLLAPLCAVLCASYPIVFWCLILLTR